MLGGGGWCWGLEHFLGSGFENHWNKGESNSSPGGRTPALSWCLTLPIMEWAESYWRSSGKQSQTSKRIKKSPPALSSLCGPATSCFVSCYSSKIKQNWPPGLILSILFSCVNPQPWGTVLDRSLIHSSCQVAQSCLTLCNPVDYTAHGILQARILEWVAFPFSRASSQPRDRAQVSRTAGRFFISWATREAHMNVPNFRKEIVLLNIKNKS